MHVEAVTMVYSISYIDFSWAYFTDQYLGFHYHLIALCLDKVLVVLISQDLQDMHSFRPQIQNETLIISVLPVAMGMKYHVTFERVNLKTFVFGDI